MLYNPTWKKPKVDRRLTIGAVIAWLEKKPADETYEYYYAHDCLAAQYNESIGREYDGGDIGMESFDDRLETIAIYRPWTFGAALERAKAMQERINGKNTAKTTG